MPKHRAGGKISGSHTTIIDAAEKVVDASDKLPEVSKIILGLIRNQVGKTQYPLLKFKEVRAGWEILVRGNATLQTLYVYTSDPEATKISLESAFNGGNGRKI